MIKQFTIYKATNGYIAVTANEDHFIGETIAEVINAIAERETSKIPYGNTLTFEQLQEIKELIPINFIQAIKAARLHSGLGLNEAKDMCDAIRNEANQ